MTPQENLRRALLNDEFPDDAPEDRLFSPTGTDALRQNRNIALSAWMTQVSGQDINAGSPTWQHDKDALAQGFFKIPTAKDITDEAIHDLVRSHIQTSDSATDLALESALSGRPLPQALGELNSLTGVSKTRGIRDRYMKEAASVYSGVAAKVAPYRGIINEAASVLSKEMDFTVPTTDAFQSVAEKLLQVPEQDRRLVIEAIGATGGATAEERSSYLNKIAATLGRYSETVGGRTESMLESLGSTVEQIANAPAEIASLLSGGGMGIQSQVAGAGERSKATQTELDRMRELQLLTDDIRKVSAQKIDPIKGNGWLENLGIGVASMVPQSAIAIANPALGYVANLAYFRDDIASNLKAQNPGMTTAQADNVAAITSPLNAAVETVTALIPWGKVNLPGVQKWMMAQTASVGAAARNLGIRALTGTAAEVGEEWLQAYLPNKAQELMQRMGMDMPGVDWEKNMPKFSEIAEETWGPALVFSLIGGGAASINDIKNGRALASDLDLLIARGTAPELATKIKEASDAGDYRKVDSLFREEFVSDVKASKPDIQAATERLKARFQTQEAVAVLQDATSPEYTASVTRSPTGWQVTTGEGTIIPVDSAEAANQIYSKLRQVGSQQEADALVSVIDGYYEKGRQAETVFTGETVQASDVEAVGVVATRRDAGGAIISQRQLGPQALETVRAEAEVAGIKSGTQGIFAHINGSNEVFPMRVADGAKEIVRRMNLYKSQAEGQPQVFTFLHENFESTWRLGIENGTFSDQETRTAMRALLPAFEGVTALNAEEAQFIDNLRTLANGQGNETMLRETVSEMVMRDVLGRDRQGLATGMKPGSISRAIEASVMGANTQEEVSALKSILAAIKAFTAYLKGVFGTVDAITKARDEGKLGEEYDTFINKVLGIDEVKQMKQAAVEEGKAILGVDEEAQAVIDAGNMAFSISPVTPAQDAEYLALAKEPEKNRTLLQRLVDGVAKMAGYNVGPVWHGGTSANEFSTLRPEFIGGEMNSFLGSFFAEKRESAERFAVGDVARARGEKGVNRSFYLKAQNPVLFKHGSNPGSDSERAIKEAGFQSVKWTAKQLERIQKQTHKTYGKDVDIKDRPDLAASSAMALGLLTKREAGLAFRAKLEQDGIDSVFIENDGNLGPVWIVPDPSQIKSADPVTRDDAGNVIPLSQRFNPETPNINFSISPIRNLNELSDQVERNFAENPAGALEVKSKVIRQFAKLADKWSNERWTPQGNKIRPISEKRTVKSLDKEQAMRQAQREVELVNEGMDKLTPNTIMAYSEGVGTLEDDPLVKKMLHDNGKLMSKATAERESRNIKDQYEDAGWIPPSWYSGGTTITTVIVTRADGSNESYDARKVPDEVKSEISNGAAKAVIKKHRTPATGGIMPDVMANNLGFDYASEMWAALESSIKSHRNAKADYAKAEAAVKAVEKAAFEQARQEAQAWRDETDAMQKEDWSPRESLVRDLITLEAIVAMFPQEIRGKIGGFVTLARKASEAARLKVLQRQLERGQELLEKHLKEQYNTAILDLLDKAVPVGKPGEVKKSKFIVTVQDELDSISELVGMDNDDVSSMIATTEAAIIAANNAEEADAALTQLNLLELFGGILDIKNTSSQELEAAHAYLDSLMKQGREARKMLDEARRERVKEMVTNAKRDAFKGQTGPETTQAARSAAAKKSGKSMLKKFFNELSGFDAVLRDAFGPKSKTATEFSERFTLNSNQFEDVQNERRKRFRDFARDLYRTKLGAVINQKLIKLERIENNSGVTYLKNREVETHKFTKEQAARIVADPKAFGFTEKDAAAISEEIQAIQNARGRRKVFTYEQVKNEGDRVEIPLSQMDALYLSMALRQPGILEQQQRYGYDQETVDQLEVFLTDDSKAWRRWMQSEYDAEYQRANEVYMRMFNTRMPMIMFYAPLLKNHQGQQAILDPLNTGISSNSANPGSIKSRKARTSSLRIESALSVFWSHFNQMEHWIANAEYLRDVQSVMLNPEVREAVVSAHGEDGMATISAWVQLQMSRGVGKAALATAGNKMFRNVKSAISMKALALSYTTTLKTLPSVFYSLGEIHMSKWPAALASGMKHWDRLWKTNIIQRRLDIGGMPELRDLGSSALPMSWVNQGIRYGSYPTMYADGVFTTYSAAMAYGTSFDDAKRQGASDEVAHQYAEERTALIVSKTAQPENWTQKSLFENDVSGAGGLFFIFTSDPRQKMALTGEALNQWRKGSATTEEAMRKFLAYWVIPGIIFQLANAIGRSVFKGDDDEWEVVDFATAALVGQLQGFVLIGSAVEMIFSAAIAAVAEKMTGEEVKKKPFWNSPKNPLDQAAQELVKSVEKITKEDGNDGMGKAWQIMKSSGMLLTPLTPAGAIPSTAERVMKDTTNLFYDDGE